MGLEIRAGYCTRLGSRAGRMWPSFLALLPAELGRYFLLCVLQAGCPGANVAGPSWGGL